KIFMETAFPQHPYGMRELGTFESVTAIKRDDIVGSYHNLLARKNLKVVVVGDIESAELSKILDTIFGALPAEPKLVPVAEITFANEGKQVVVKQEGRQTYIQFGAQGIKRKDPDFMPAYLFDHLLGGDGFSSRLYKELREKRGLTYGVYTSLAA